MRYYLIAGERSGDLHTGNLVKEIKSLDNDATFRGFGGEYMKAAGVDLAVHYEKLAFMGFFEVVKNYGTIASYTKKCKEDMLAFNPDVLILVDYAGFNMRIASFAKEKGIRVFYYIAPKVWAWYQKRALKLIRTVDRMFVILPFEKQFFKAFNWDVDYVGNPVLDAVKVHERDTSFLTRHNLSSDSPLVALLPGSRRQELQEIVPLMADVAKKNPAIKFAVATIRNMDPELYSELTALKNVVTVEEDTYNLLLHARAAIVTSGTATLETALFKVPQVVVYRTHPVTYWIVKLLIKVKFISLVNLIANDEVIKELIQTKATAPIVSSELTKLIEEGDYRRQVLVGYDKVRKTLDVGSASHNAATLMVADLAKQQIRRD